MENENEEDLSAIFKNYRVDIVKSIDTENPIILFYLQSKFVLDSDDCERINSGKTRVEKAGKLLDILSLKGSEALHHFKDALEIYSPTLYEKITGKKADSRIDKTPFIDFDRQFLANQLDRAIADLRNMTYWQSKVVEEKNLLELKLSRATDDLQTKEKCMEDIMQSISDWQAEETEKSSKDSHTPMHNYLQELWRENLEKSRVMIALQKKVILANEQIETLKKTITEVATKCDDLEKENRELKIVNNYERTNSVKLSKSANEQADEHKREFNRLKLQYTIVCKEKDSLEKELDSFQKLTERLNARFDALKQEKTVLKDSSEDLSNRLLRLQDYIEELQGKQTWQNFKIERSEHEVNRLKSAFETARVDRDRILQSLQEVRLARDEADKENYQLRSNLKDLQVRSESDIERQRILFDELWKKHEDLLEELKLMEERACDAEKGLKSAEQALERKEKEEDDNLAQHDVVSKPENSQRNDPALPEINLVEHEEQDTSIQELVESIMPPKRKRDSLIDSIRRKLLTFDDDDGDDDEVIFKGTTLPPNFGKSEKIQMHDKILLKYQSLPLFTRSRKMQYDNAGREKDGVGKQNGGRILTRNIASSLMQRPSNPGGSRGLEPFRRDRCYCVKGGEVIRTRRRRSRSVPAEFHVGQMYLQPKED